MTHPSFEGSTAPPRAPSIRETVTRSTSTSLLRFRLVELAACALADLGVMRYRIEEALKQARFEEFAVRAEPASRHEAA
jgi:hypothetical protein